MIRFLKRGLYEHFMTSKGYRNQANCVHILCWDLKLSIFCDLYKYITFLFCWLDFCEYYSEHKNLTDLRIKVTVVQRRHKFFAHI